MKILHLIYDHPDNPWVGGGGAIRALEINKLLAAGGHDITVISGKFPGIKNHQSDGMRFKFIGSDVGYTLSTFSYAFGASKFIKAHSTEYDVVVEDFATWNPVWSCWYSKVPTVLHVNHREGFNVLKRFGPFGLPFYLIESFYPSMFKHVTALSKGTRTKINVPSAHIVTAGIDAKLLEDTSTPNPESTSDIIYIGRLEINNKGLDTLMSAMHSVKGKLLLMGKGRDEDKLRHMARGLNVEFAGFVSEEKKLRLIQGTKLLVLPSRFEGWGIVTLEAAACSKPVVVSDIPELNYAVENKFGLAFRTGDGKELADKLNYLIDNNETRASLGKEARAFAQKHTWQEISIGYEKFLEGIIAGK